MKLLLSIYFLVLTLLSFSQDTLYKKFYYPDSTVSGEGYLVNGKPDYYWKNYYPDGILKSIGRRSFSELDSIWCFYDESGLISNRVSYLNGKKHGYNEIFETIDSARIKKAILRKRELYIDNLRNGKTTEYDKNGNAIKEIPFVNGKREGFGFDFSPNGIVKGVYTYQDNELLKYELVNQLNEKGEKIGTWKDFYNNGEIKYERNYVEGKLNGLAKVYNDKGQVKKLYKYQKDTIIQEENIELQFEEPEETITYHKNGKIKSRGIFIDSLPYGIHREYDENGKVINSATFDKTGKKTADGIVLDNGNKQGEWKYYNSTENIESKGIYRNNKRNGNWIYYYPDGKIKQKGQFINDLFSGIWIWYYANGAVKRKESYISGRRDGLSSEYSKDTILVAEGIYVDDYKDGNWIELVGDNKEIGNYRLGNKHGFWKHYYTSGNLRFEGEFKLGREDGKHVYYYENANIEHIEYYKSGKRIKKWLYYKPNGTVYLMVFYKKGKEDKIISLE